LISINRINKIPNPAIKETNSFTLNNEAKNKSTASSFIAKTVLCEPRPNSSYEANTCDLSSPCPDPFLKDVGLQVNTLYLGDQEIRPEGNIIQASLQPTPGEKDDPQHQNPMADEKAALEEQPLEGGQTPNKDLTLHYNEESCAGAPEMEILPDWSDIKAKGYYNPMPWYVHKERRPKARTDPNQSQVSVDTDQELAKLLKDHNITETTLTLEEKQQLLSVLQDHDTVFSKRGFDLGCYREKFPIETGTAVPIYDKPRRVPYGLRKAMEDELTNLLENNIIRPSRSPWAAPVSFVGKKDGTLRLVNDYRRINKILHAPGNPLPRIDDILASMYGSGYFTSIDLTKGFWQIPLNDQAIPKTAITTPYGLYEFLRLPFGMNLSPAIFQSVMEGILRGIAHVFVYIDDIIIYTPDIQLHLQILSMVLQRLQEENMKAKLNKCEFARTELLYLGHVINRNGIHTDPGKVSRILELPPPGCANEIEIFLGKTGYFSKFIENYAEIARPLFELKKKNSVWNFGPEQRQSFEDLKECLTKAPVLKHPDMTREFIVATDASGYGIGAILTQLFEDGEHPIAYRSRLLKDAELRYSTIEREALGLCYGIYQFEEYLVGNHFTVYVDHKPLEALMQKVQVNRRLEAYRLKLQHLRFTIVYRAGKENGPADCLSRYPYVPTKGKNSKLTQTNESMLNGYDPNADLASQTKNRKVRKRAMTYEAPRSSAKMPLMAALPVSQEAETQVHQRTDGDTSSMPIPEIELTSEKAAKGLRLSHSGGSPTLVTGACPKDMSSETGELSKQRSVSCPDLTIVLAAQSGPNLTKSETHPSPIITKIAARPSANLLVLETHQGQPGNLSNNQEEQDQGPAVTPLTNLARAQREDPNYADIIRYLTDGTLPPNNEDARTIIYVSELYDLDEHHLLRRYLPKERTHAPETPVLCVPRTMVDQIFHDAHATPTMAHRGMGKTTETILREFWWPTYSIDIRRMCRECIICSRHKHPPHLSRQHMGDRSPPTTVFERVHMDVWSPGGDSNSGMRYVIAFIDAFSKYLIAVPTQDHTAETVARVFLNHVVLIHGMPKELVSDGAPEFHGRIFNQLTAAFGCLRRITTPYRPQANGQIERVFATIRPMLAAIAESDPTNWDKYMPSVIYAYNSAYHHTVQDTPYYLMYGRDPRPPLPISVEMEDLTSTNEERIELLNQAREAIHSALLEDQQRNKEYYDQRGIPQRFALEKLVMLMAIIPHDASPRKLFPRYVGPYRIKRIIRGTLGVVPLGRPDDPIRYIHMDRAKSFYMSPENGPVPPMDQDLLLTPFMDPASIDAHLEAEALD